MDTVIGFIKWVPIAVWSAIIASLLTLFGVLLTNYGNNRRLIRQLSHDAVQRDRERAMEMRRQVYLDAAEAVTANHMVLMNLPNLEIPDSELGEQFSKSAATISKVNVVGSSDTVRAVSEFSLCLAGKYLQLTAKRLPFIQRKILKRRPAR